LQTIADRVYLLIDAIAPYFWPLAIIMFVIGLILETDLFKTWDQLEDERLDRKIADLENQLRSRPDYFPEDKQVFALAFVLFVDKKDAPTALWQEFIDIGWEALAPPDIETPTFKNEIEKGRYADRLIEKVRAQDKASLEAFVEALAASFKLLIEKLPRFAQTDVKGRGIGTVRLADLIQDFDIFIETIALPGISFARLANVTIPFEIPLSRLIEHGVLVAGSGHGKTETLGSLIASFLKQDDPPGMVVLDSTGAIINHMQRLAVFNDRLKDRIVIIDPEHSPAPGLNMFDISTPRFKAYSPAQREAAQAELVDLFQYMFSSIDNPLTDPMKTALAYMVRLLLTIKDANITMFRKLLEENVKTYEASSFHRYMDGLDPGAAESSARDFFKKQFFTERVSGTKASILQRLSSIISLPAFERMFTTTNEIDFFEEMNKQSIILVNTNENILKSSSTLFGRYIIARCMAAAFERAPIDPDDRKPVLLIIDEALPYFDEMFEKLWTRVRQYKLGVFTAFQHLKKLNESLKGALASSTSVKIIGGLGYDDRRWIARDMHTSPEFIKEQERDQSVPPQWTHFACYVGSFTPRAVSLHVPFYTLGSMPQMTPEEHRELLRRNRQRVSSRDAPSNFEERSGPSAAAAGADQSEEKSTDAKQTEEARRRADPPTAPSEPPVKADDDAAADWQ
jgi:hypothetical protein